MAACGELGDDADRVVITAPFEARSGTGIQHPDDSACKTDPGTSLSFMTCAAEESADGECHRLSISSTRDHWNRGQ